jgi:hypothetical protein
MARPKSSTPLSQQRCAAAKQNHDGNKQELNAYHVGERIEQQRSTLEQAVEDILNKLKTNTLPGIKPAKVEALKTALAAYKGGDSTQSGAQSDASGKRLSLDDLMALVNKDRRKILFAVDGEWSSTIPANAAIRIEFGLPPNRPYSGWLAREPNQKKAGNPGLFFSAHACRTRTALVECAPCLVTKKIRRRPHPRWSCFLHASFWWAVRWRQWRYFFWDDSLRCRAGCSPPKCLPPSLGCLCLARSSIKSTRTP